MVILPFVRCAADATALDAFNRAWAAHDSAQAVRAGESPSGLGIGLVAKRDIRKDDVVLDVSLDNGACLMSTSAARAFSRKSSPHDATVLCRQTIEKLASTCFHLAPRTSCLTQATHTRAWIRRHVQSVATLATR